MMGLFGSGNSSSVKKTGGGIDASSDAVYVDMSTHDRMEPVIAMATAVPIPMDQHQCAAVAPQQHHMAMATAITSCPLPPTYDNNSHLLAPVAPVAPQGVAAPLEQQPRGQDPTAPSATAYAPHYYQQQQPGVADHSTTSRNPVTTPNVIAESAVHSETKQSSENTKAGTAVVTKPHANEIDELVITRRKPVMISTCTMCDVKNKKSITTTSPHLITWAMCILLLGVKLWYICWLPLLIDGCKQTQHTCSKCGSNIGKSIPPFTGCCISTKRK